MTSLVSTGKSQTFKPVFFENVISQLLLFKNLRQNWSLWAFLKKKYRGFLELNEVIFSRILDGKSQFHILNLIDE